MASISQRSESALDDFVETLRERMQKRQISISELARLAGVGRPYLHRVLNGEQVPTIDWMEKVGEHLGIKIKVTIR